MSRSPAGAPGTKLTLEQLDRLDGCIAEMNEAWNDRFDFARPEILKRYLVSEICIHLQFRVHFGKMDSQDFCATWFGPQKQVGPLIGFNAVDLRVGHLSAEMDCVGNMGGANRNREKLMLVGNVEVVDDSKGGIENRIAEIGVLVRLQALDDRLSAAGDALYYSALFGLFKFCLIEADRELSFEGGRVVPFEHECPNQMVKAGTQVVDYLANQNRETQGDGLPVRGEGARLRFMIDVSHDEIVVRMNKSGDFVVEILDTLVGPLNLRPTSVQWR